MKNITAMMLASLIFWGMASSESHALQETSPPESPQTEVPHYMPINSAGCVGGQCPMPESRTSPRPNPAVVRIIVVNERSRSYGSGTLVRDDASYYFILTCAHLFDKTSPQRIMILFPDNRTFDVQLRAIDRTWDLAILQNEARLPQRDGELPLEISVPLGQSAPQVGETLFYAGYGSSGQYQVCRGKVEGYCAVQSGMPAEMLVITGSARQGDSGGPILNTRGELVGVLWGTDSRTVCGTYNGRIYHFVRVAQQENRLLGPFTREKNPGNMSVIPQNTPPAPDTFPSSTDKKPPLSEILDQLFTHYPDVVRQFMQGDLVGASAAAERGYGDSDNAAKPAGGGSGVAAVTDEIALKMEKKLMDMAGNLVKQHSQGILSGLISAVIYSLSYSVPPAAVIMFVAHQVARMYFKRRKENEPTDDEEDAEK